MTRAVRQVALAIALAATVPTIAAEPPVALPSAPALAGVDPATGASTPLDPSPGPMLLAFVATWCRPCLADLPRLTDVEDRWKTEGLRVFTIALSTRQSIERLREWSAKEPPPGRLLFDGDGSIAAAVGATDIPLYLLVDRHGRIVARSAAIDAGLKQQIERLARQEGRAQP